MTAGVLPEQNVDSEAVQLAAADELVQGESIWILKTTDGYMRGEVVSACSITGNGLEVRTGCGRRLRIATLDRTWRFEKRNIPDRLRPLIQKIAQSRLSGHRKGSQASPKTSSSGGGEVFRTSADAATTSVARSLVWNPKKPKATEALNDEKKHLAADKTVSRWRRIRLEFLGGPEESIHVPPGPFVDSMGNGGSPAAAQTAPSTPSGGNGLLAAVRGLSGDTSRRNSQGESFLDVVQRSQKAFGKRSRTVEPENS